MLRQLPNYPDENLLSAAIPFADAGVYRIAADLALVQSVDFFTPIVDDPYLFGRIAAANALSDLYAMGARPLTALNLIGFPKCLDRSLLVEILRGGAEACHAAGATVVGGHTVEDDEPKYGLAVTGLVNPAQLVSTVGAQPGDQLILTKPLGTGILATALRGEILTATDISAAIAGMNTLNRAAAEAMLSIGVHACTDITGFGLLGHALELALASNVGLTLNGAALPVYPQVREMAAIGMIPAGGYNNRDYYLGKVIDADRIAPDIIDIISDPQTSGGLLIAVTDEKAAALCAELSARGTGCWRIGTVTSTEPGRLKISLG